MFKFLRADEYRNSIADIDIAALASRGIKAVILDIDNTLEVYHTPSPGARTFDFVKSLSQHGIDFAILSNNSVERAAEFCDKLTDNYMGKAGKPLKKGYNYICEKLGLKPCEIACIGDQLFTDIWGGNRAGCYTVFVKPIDTGYEPPFVRFKRLFEKPFLRGVKYE